MANNAPEVKSKAGSFVADIPAAGDDDAGPKKQAGQKMEELNLTSMLDVTFQLLIFFVLTASFAMSEGILAAELPKLGGASSETAEEPPDKPVKIRLTAAGYEQVLIQVEGQRRVNDFEDLYQLLAGLQYNDTNAGGIYKEDNPIIIEPGNETGWGFVVSAFNACIRAKYISVSFGKSDK